MMEKQTMKALRVYDAHDYRYEDVAIPEPGPGELLIKVKGCGICAGDLKAYSGSPAAWGTSKEERLLETPVSPGHEFCGEVCKLGEGVKDFRLGDFVVAEQIVPCGECADCKRGTYWLCSKLKVFGLKQETTGGFAEYVRLPANARVHKVPEGMSVEQAALIEPYACGMHAAERAQVRHEDVVVVSGMGPIGLAIINIVRLSLPRCIIGLDTNPNRLKMGLEFGADMVFNPAECDLDAEIKKLTDNVGCDVYIEASGYGASVEQGLTLIRNHGRYVQFGMQGDKVLTNWNTIGDGKELTIYGSHLSALCYPAVIRGIQSGLLRTEGLISHTFPLSEWKTAFETPKNDKTAMKIMFTP